MHLSTPLQLLTPPPHPRLTQQEPKCKESDDDQRRGYTKSNSNDPRFTGCCVSISIWPRTRLSCVPLSAAWQHADVLIAPWLPALGSPAASSFTPQLVYYCRVRLISGSTFIRPHIRRRTSQIPIMIKSTKESQATAAAADTLNSLSYIRLWQCSISGLRDSLLHWW